MFAFHGTSRGAALFAVLFFGGVAILHELDCAHLWTPAERTAVVLAMTLIAFVPATLSHTRLAIGEDGIEFAPHGWLGAKSFIPYREILSTAIVSTKGRAEFVIVLQSSTIHVVRWASWNTRLSPVRPLACKACETIQEKMKRAG